MVIDDNLKLGMDNLRRLQADIADRAGSWAQDLPPLAKAVPGSSVPDVNEEDEPEEYARIPALTTEFQFQVVARCVFCNSTVVCTTESGGQRLYKCQMCDWTMVWPLNEKSQKIADRNAEKAAMRAAMAMETNDD